MIHVFTDGRILFRDDLLRAGDEGKYISVEALPDVEAGENQQVMFFADLEKKTVGHRLIDTPPEECGAGAEAGGGYD